jgi:hypothetical protein
MTTENGESFLSMRIFANSEAKFDGNKFSIDMIFSRLFCLSLSDLLGLGGVSRDLDP